MTRHPDGTVTVTYKLDVTRGRKGHRRVSEPAAPSEAPTLDPAKVPQATRMLVLGYYFERLVQEGKVKNYAEIARLTGLSRARISQIASLTLQAPKDVENLLVLAQSDQDPTTTPASNAPESLMPSGP